MKKTHLRALACLIAAAALTGCGGGSDGTASNGGGNDANSGAKVYSTVLAQLNSAAGLNSPSVARAFDDAYLDSGMRKSHVLDALSQDATALGTTSDYSLFPQLALSDAQVTNCDSKNVCTLTGTLTNEDADSTSVPISVKVVNDNGTYRLLGDQQLAS